jgi:hypothetical protein
MEQEKEAFKRKTSFLFESKGKNSIPNPGETYSGNPVRFSFQDQPDEQIILHLV